VEAVLFSFVADERLSILLYAIVLLTEVFGLGVCQWHSIYVDRSGFVISDATCENLRLPNFDADDPLPPAVLGEWDVERITVRSDQKDPVPSGWFYNRQPIRAARKGSFLVGVCRKPYFFGD
jgi:hypothetical protein